MAQRHDNRGTPKRGSVAERIAALQQLQQPPQSQPKPPPQTQRSPMRRWKEPNSNSGPTPPSSTSHNPTTTPTATRNRIKNNGIASRIQAMQHLQLHVPTSQTSRMRLGRGNTHPDVDTSGNSRDLEGGENECPPLFHVERAMIGAGRRRGRRLVSGLKLSTE